jgi:hypothetical protein
MSRVFGFCSENASGIGESKESGRIILSSHGRIVETGK